MSNYSSNFPTQRPSLNLVFNGGSDQLDSRISFSRADTPPTYAAPSAVHYWSNEKHKSSENLVTQSDGSDWIFDTADYAKTASQNGPDGSTNATKFTEKANGTVQYQVRSQNFIPIANQEITYSVWLKQTSGSRDYQQIRVGNIGSNMAFATFNLTNGTVDQTGGTLGVSASVNAGPTGWYQCVLRFTPTSTTALTFYIYAAAASGGEVPNVTGDTGNSYTLFGAQASTLGETVVNETSGQIHRSYAPTLKSVANAGDPRFEYSPADGQSVGLKIESQVSNIFPYSRSGVNGSGAMQFNAGDASIEKQVAIGPDGNLSAMKIVPDTSPASHYVYTNVIGTPDGNSKYTVSCYAKAAGEDTLAIRLTSTYSAFSTAVTGTFTLTGNGTAVAVGGTATAQITEVGNGFYLCSLTETTDSSPTGMRPFFFVRQTSIFTGNGYDGLLLACFQVEKNSAPSSWIDTGTAGAAATRSADSCSVATSSFGYSGGPVSIVAETEAGAGTGNNPRLFNLNDGSSTTRLMLYKNSTAANNTVAWYAFYGAAGMGTLAGSNNSSKVAVSVDTNDFAATSDTGTLLTNATGTQYTFSELYVGSNYNGTAHHINGHVKRLALYNVALSDTELAALTS